MVKVFSIVDACIQASRYYSLARDGTVNEVNRQSRLRVLARRKTAAARTGRNAWPESRGSIPGIYFFPNPAGFG
jgi:hypothetical protein